MAYYEYKKGKDRIVAILDNKLEVVEKVEIPKAEEIGTSLGDLFKNIKL